MISFLAKQLRRLSAWWSSHRRPGAARHAPAKPRYVARYVDDSPERPEYGYVYLVGEGLYLWFAILRCPCGCGDVIQLPLVQGRGPKWTAITDAHGAVTLRPSIWRRVGCHSHFIVQSGQILWMGDTGEPPPTSIASI